MERSWTVCPGHVSHKNSAGRPTLYAAVLLQVPISGSPKNPSPQIAEVPVPSASE